MSTSTVVLIFSNVLSFSLGGLMWRFIAIKELWVLNNEKRAGTHMAPPPPVESDVEEPDDEESGRGLRIRDLMIAMVLVASLILIGLGIQQHRYQAQQRTHDACVNTWGRSLIRTVGQRTDATTRLDKATRQLNQARAARDDAVSNVLLTVIHLRQSPPQGKPHDFDKALAQFARTNAHLTTVTAHTNKVSQQVIKSRASHPFPQLNCSE